MVCSRTKMTNTNRNYNRSNMTNINRNYGITRANMTHNNNHQVVDMESVDEKLEKVSPEPQDCCIFRIPGRLRKLNFDAYRLYTPQLVSIGPVHSPNSFVYNGPARLRDKAFPFQAMEEKKLIYMNSLLARTGPDQRTATLEKCKKVINEVAQEARLFYEDPMDRNNRELGRILLVDGCFILELFIKHFEGDTKGPVFSNAWMVVTLQRDLSLMENQIPFLVIEKLFEEIRDQISVNCRPKKEISVIPPEVQLVQLAIDFFASAWNLKKEILETKYSLRCKHFLDLLRECYLPAPESIKERSKNNKTEWENIHSALDLASTGIKFKKSESHNIFDIKYSNGVLEIPSLRVDDLTETLLKNLIAFEQCCPGSEHYITSYVLFMDRLINSWRDVSLLEKKQIIFHIKGNSAHVSVMFNNICKEVVLKDDYFFAEECVNINIRYKSAWLKRFAKLKDDHFPNLWKAVAFVAAFLLLCLTALQTVYTIVAYYQS